MGTLTSFLQGEFERLCPSDWVCRREVRLLPPSLERALGYSPRSDILLEHRAGHERLWVEFEVSRADPVANHAKFATAHMFLPQATTDAFVAMVSPHVDRGRRNLAANMVAVMRQIGMNAFQTVLLPGSTAAEIQRMNHLSLDGLAREPLPVGPEMERLFAVVRPVARVQGRRIHLAGELTDVLLNVRRWNEEMETQAGARLWGRRTVTYFVFDPVSGEFAPSKYCAYIPIDITAARSRPASQPPGRPVMSMDVYGSLESSEACFDGSYARNHLEQRLAMVPKTPSEADGIAATFAEWLCRHDRSIGVHPTGPVFLLPPAWFR